MASDWSSLIGSKATEILPRLRASSQDTALAVLEELCRTGRQIVLDGDTLRVRPAVGLEVGKRILKHKEGILALLRAPWWREDGFNPPIGWEQEWHVEQDMLRRRMACCADARVVHRLAILAAYPVENSNEWAELWQRIGECEADLRQRGELPPALYWG